MGRPAIRFIASNPARELLTLVGERLHALRRAARRSADPRHRDLRRPAGWERMSPGERVLAMVAMRQRAAAA